MGYAVTGSYTGSLDLQVVGTAVRNLPSNDVPFVMSGTGSKGQPKWRGARLQGKRMTMMLAPKPEK